MEITKKQKFIEEINSLINPKEALSEEAFTYWLELQTNDAGSEVTEAGARILNWMQENEEKYANQFTSKVIGEGLFVSPRSVSGTIRKLVTDGYVTKESANPVIYALTEGGRQLMVKGVSVEN